MIRSAAIGCLAVLCALISSSPAQTGTMQISSTGSGGRYSLTGTYSASPMVGAVPSGAITFEDTSYSNAVLATIPLSAATPVSSLVTVGLPYGGTIQNVPGSNLLARDFDGDGKPDLLFLSSGNSSPSLIFIKGNGDGTFQNAVNTSFAPGNSMLLATGDFNGDGKPDIACSGPSTFNEPETEHVYIALGNGDGTFQAPTTLTASIPLNARQLALLTGDFNGDGKIDLFSSTGISANLYLGEGDGTFQTAIATPPAYGYVSAVDINGDGRTDITGGYTNYILLGKASGGFEQVGTSSPGQYAGDFNHDGKLDFASWTYDTAGATGISVSLGNGDGTFQTPITSTNLIPAPTYFMGGYDNPVVADFNGDGNLDLAMQGAYYLNKSDAINQSGTGMVTVLFGKGDGTFQTGITNTPFSSSSSIWTATADVNVDGVSDFISIHRNPGSYPSSEIWSFSTVTSYQVTANDLPVTPTGPHAIVARYLGDSHYPAATSAPLTLQGATAVGSLTLTSSTASSTYLAPLTLTATLIPCVVGTYSCDQDTISIYEGSTLVGSSKPTSGVFTMTTRNLAQGSHTLHAVFVGNTFLSTTTSNTITINVGPPARVITSLNLALSGQVDNYTLTATMTSPVRITPPSGDITFSEGAGSSLKVYGTAPLTAAGYAVTTDSVISDTPGSSTPFPYHFYVGDFDHDGKVDVLYSGGGFWKGLGNDTILTKDSKAGGSFPLAIADFNGDGNLDTAETDGASVSIYLGNGTGAFTFARDYSFGVTSGGTYQIFAGDFNGDGKQDLLFDNIGKYQLLLGNNDGTFQAPIQTSIQPNLAADFNQDGRTDLFSTSGVYLGQTNATFTLVAPSSGTYPAAVLTADFNKDGKPDVLTANNSILLGKGDGSFQDPIPVDFSTGFNGTFRSPAYFTGDFNGDGNPDVGLVIFASNSTESKSIIVWIFGDGTGHFSNKIVYDQIYSDVSLYIPTYAADFNNDGADDLLSITPGSNYPYNSFYTRLWRTKFQYTAQINGISTTDAGNHYVNAFYPGDSTYMDVRSNSVTLQGRTQPSLTLSINPNPPTPGSPVTITAILSPSSNFSISTDGEPITFFDNGNQIGTATLASGTAQLTRTLSNGAHSITASYAGDSAFRPATSTPAPVAVTVPKITPTITWPTPAAITYGTPLSATQFNATTTIAGTFSYSPAVGTILSTGVQTLTATFTPNDTTTYNSATATVTLTVNKATPSITWPTPAAITYGAPLSATQLNATSAIAGTFVYSPAAGTVLAVGSQTLTTTFTPTDISTYNSATATVTLTVNKVTPTITWPTPAAITYGTPLSATQLNATSAVAGAFAYFPAAGTVLTTGSQTLSTTLTPTNTANYSNATATTTLLVNKATPAISLTRTSPSASSIGTGVTTTFQATLVAAYGTPSGNVLLYDGATNIGTGVITGGTATITTTFSTPATHAITAAYAGDTNFTTVTSSALNETVILSGLSFSATPNPLVIKQGQSGSATITVTPFGNYAGSVNFSCSGLPLNTSCTFSPASITFNGNNQQQTSVITVNTQKTTAALRTESGIRLASLLTLPFLALTLRRRRLLQRALLAICATVALLPSIGCGATTPSNLAPTGTQNVAVSVQTSTGVTVGQPLNLSVVIQ